MTPATCPFEPNKRLPDVIWWERRWIKSSQPFSSCRESKAQAQSRPRRDREPSESCQENCDFSYDPVTARKDEPVVVCPTRDSRETGLHCTVLCSLCRARVWPRLVISLESASDAGLFPELCFGNSGWHREAAKLGWCSKLLL